MEGNMDFSLMLNNDLNLRLSDLQKHQFAKYFNLLVEWNEKVNLTSILDEESVFIKHFYDSLTISLSVDLSKVKSICDVGAGAGFPSIPLKIMFPHLSVTIVDSLGKRITFLNTLKEELNLDDVTLIHGRAENFAKKKREYFDLVTARAVARLNVLTELCLPLVKVNGYFVAMKALDADDEVVEAKSAIHTLGGIIDRIIELNLPHSGGNRKLVKIEKIKHTNGIYPRDYAKIKQKPL